MTLAQRIETDWLLNRMKQRYLVVWLFGLPLGLDNNKKEHL